MATTGVVNGTLMGIYIGGVKIAKATQATLSVTHNTRASVNKDDEGWEKNLQGSRSWSISGDSEFAFEDSYGPEDIFDAIAAGTEVDVEFSTEVAGDICFAGAAQFDSFEISAAAEDNTTYSYSMKGNGKLEKETVTT